MKRVPSQKPNTILFVRARSAREPNPDWWVSWGDGTYNCDANLVLSELRKLSDELVRREYDPESIRFTAKKDLGAKLRKELL